MPFNLPYSSNDLCNGCDLTMWQYSWSVDNKRATRKDAIKWAQDKVNNSDWLVFDTETTGLIREKNQNAIVHQVGIVQIGICDSKGRVLLNALIKPDVPITAEATQKAHQLEAKDVAVAPTFADLYPAIRKILEGRSVVVYNAFFDSAVLAQCIARAGFAPFAVGEWRCVMEIYATYKGEWNEEHNNNRFWNLTQACKDFGIKHYDAHTAIGDCRATLSLIQAMAKVTV